MINQRTSISDRGATAAVFWHTSSKTNQQDWAKAVREGKLSDAILKLTPKAKQPFTVHCDNESFLRAKERMRVYRAKHIVLWDCPPKSPDLNPVEMFWGWMRKKLRRMDLADLRKKRKPLGKVAYPARLKSVLNSVAAQKAAKNFANRLRKTCREVMDWKGAASDA